MNELTQTARQLPDNLEDLSKFVLIGREKLNAVRAEIRAIKAVELAAEVHEQKLQEAQEIAEAVLDAETKLGELTSEMATAQGQRADLQLHPSGGEKSKAQQLADLGIKHHERYEMLAKYPEYVEEAKKEARENDRIVTRQNVLDKIAPSKSTQQSMREFKQQAREEHEEFKQAAKEDVVDFEEAKKDKDNLEIIALDISITIDRALAAVSTLGLLKESEIKIMLDHMKGFAKSDLSTKISNRIRVLLHLQKLIEGGK